MMQINIEIVRLFTDRIYGTFGAMKIDKKLLCWTLEPRLYFNQPEVSAIPEGQYHVEQYYSNRFAQNLYRVVDVPGRSGIAFHAGNTAEDTSGCILLGTRLDSLGPERTRRVLSSGEALNLFHSTLSGNTMAFLTITNKY